jgi:hypothetical protein
MRLCLAVSMHLDREIVLDLKLISEKVLARVLPRSYLNHNFALLLGATIKVEFVEGCCT